MDINAHEERMIREELVCTMRTIDHFIAGGTAGLASGRSSDVFDPNSGAVQAQLMLGDAAVLDRAVAAAQAAQPGWAATNPQRRARVMFNFKALVEKHMDELAYMLSSEHGKVIADSKGDIQRGLEVVEFCCGIPHVLKGEIGRAPGRASISSPSASPLASEPGSHPSTFRR